MKSKMVIFPVSNELKHIFQDQEAILVKITQIVISHLLHKLAKKVFKKDEEE
jgi:hypothetical protein